MANKIKKCNISIDKLRLCYTQPENLIANIMERENGGIIDFDDFSLRINESEQYGEKVIQINADLFLHRVKEDQERTRIGSFVFHNTSKYKGKCFFTFENSALYHIDSIVYGTKYNLMTYLNYVTDELHLVLNNVTEMEIACDTNINVIRIIRQFIKNHNEYYMFKNGRIVRDPNRHIDDYDEHYGRSRNRLESNPSLYVKQKSLGVQLHLKVYDKSREMQLESPYKIDYINEWNEFSDNDRTYRMEVTIGNTDFRAWTDHLRSKASAFPNEWKDPSKVLNMLMLEDYRWALWYYCCNRLLYFRDRTDGTDITLLDIVGGARP